MKKLYFAFGIIVLVSCIGLFVVNKFYKKGKEKLPIQDSRLYKDLYRDHRDAMYRAMTFIKQQGGPLLPGDTKDVLIAHRKKATQWLLSQEESRKLIVTYDEFYEKWSPIFHD